MTRARHGGDGGEAANAIVQKESSSEKKISDGAYLGPELLLGVRRLAVGRLHYGVGKLQLKVALAAEERTKADKVKEGPQLAEVVLDGRAWRARGEQVRMGGIQEPEPIWHQQRRGGHGPERIMRCFDATSRMAFEVWREGSLMRWPSSRMT